MTRVAVVFGTFNRIEMLKRAVTSVRAAVGPLTYKMIIVDGGSTDGTREWLRGQPDVQLIEQTGPLTGAVRAFNLGFAAAVDGNYDFIAHLNDDAEIVTPGAIAKACEILCADSKLGEVAFEFDLRGPWNCEYVNGMLYANFGVVRREAGIAVARAQGDPSGRAWWNPIYRTYGADTEFGMWLWKLGWVVQRGTDLRVHDVNAKDTLRANNEGAGQSADSSLFWNRWRHVKPGTDLPPEPSDFCAPYNEWLVRFIREHHVKRVVDLGCAHLELMRSIDLKRYCGADLVKERVDMNAAKYPRWRFKRRDLRTWVPRDVDLVLCKDVLQYWTTADVQGWLKQFEDHKHRFRYMLIVNYNYGPAVNADALAGNSRALDLTTAPFSRGTRVFQWGVPNKDVVLVRGERARH